MRLSRSINQGQSIIIIIHQYVGGLWGGAARGSSSDSLRALAGIVAFCIDRKVWSLLIANLLKNILIFYYESLISYVVKHTANQFIIIIIVENGMH